MWQMVLQWITSDPKCKENMQQRKLLILNPISLLKFRYLRKQNIVMKCCNDLPTCLLFYVSIIHNQLKTS